jgi:hypothetical protein
MQRDTHLTDDINDRLPIIPHQDLGAEDCCGCLVVDVKGDQAEILCNECLAVIRTVPLEDVEKVMAELAQTDTICSATCTHCGAVNMFPGFSSMMAFICSECGEGVVVTTPVQ